jgi:hypothetical protein
VEIIMALTPTESQQMGRIEANVDILVKRGDDCDLRLNKLEAGSSKIKGALAILSLLFTLGCAYIVAGCAHYHNTTYFPSGDIAQEIVSTVLGAGEATIVDGDNLYSTRDNGVSDNALEAVEVGVTVTPPGAAAGVLGGLLDEILE